MAEQHQRDDSSHTSSSSKASAPNSPRKPVTPRTLKAILQRECKKRRLSPRGTREELLRRIRQFEALPPLSLRPSENEYSKFNVDAGRRSMQEIWLRKPLAEMRALCHTFGMSTQGGRFELAGRIADYFRRKGLEVLSQTPSEDEFSEAQETASGPAAEDIMATHRSRHPRRAKSEFSTSLTPNFPLRSALKRDNPTGGKCAKVVRWMDELDGAQSNENTKVKAEKGTEDEEDLYLWGKEWAEEAVKQEEVEDSSSAGQPWSWSTPSSEM